MDLSTHTMHDLFAQLGLPNDEASVQDFIASHRPVAPELPLPQAPFWTSAQAQFLREQFVRDADWAEVVDQLNLALRA
jgi:hypothetical protein